MKRLSLYLFLLLFTLQTPSLADDIRDFQIEGMSIGDSLLDYYTESEIKRKNKNYFKNKEFSVSGFKVKNDLYSSIDVVYRSNDNNYTIEGLVALENYIKNINKCYTDMNDVVKEISDDLIGVENVKKFNEQTVKHKVDKSGKSTIKEVIFLFKTRDRILIQCYDWSKEMKYVDHLRVVFRTAEYQNFISHKAYK